MVGTLVGGVGVHLHGVTLILTFDFAVVTLTFKILSRLYVKTVRCRKLILGRDIDWKLYFPRLSGMGISDAFFGFRLRGFHKAVLGSNLNPLLNWKWVKMK